MRRVSEPFRAQVANPAWHGDRCPEPTCAREWPTEQLRTECLTAHGITVTPVGRVQQSPRGIPFTGLSALLAALASLALVIGPAAAPAHALAPVWGEHGGYFRHFPYRAVLEVELCSRHTDGCKDYWRVDYLLTPWVNENRQIVRRHGLWL